MYFIAEVSDIRRFSSYKKLIGYAGIDPSVYESGRFRGRSKISKRGNKYLRRTIFLMAQKVVRHVEVFRQYYQVRMAKENSYRKAMICVSHKLLRTIYAMLKNRMKFQPAVAYS